MEVLIRPLVTEKMTILGDKLNRYGFLVDPRANKIQIKKAVKEMYGVNVDEVNTMRYDGKFKSRFTRAGVIAGKKSEVKKAIITLAEGEKIDFYSNI
jgi:large subunit ribosomal protein L23